MKKIRMLTLAAGLCTLAGFPSALHAQQRPNIIFIYADDLGYGDVSCYGMKRIQTPNIDRLARQGVRFTNGYATSATCSPSRYGILTGRYPWRQQNTGIAPGDAALIIPRDHKTLPGMLQDAGYQTAVIGKWHLGIGEPGTTIDWNADLKPGPLEVGFNYAYIMPATLDRVPCVFVENHRVAGLDPADPITVSYKHKVGNDPTGKENPEKLRMRTDPRQGHDQTIVDSISRIGWMSGGNSARWKDENIAGIITQKAIDFIGKNKSQPFLFTLPAAISMCPVTRTASSGVRAAWGCAAMRYCSWIGPWASSPMRWTPWG